MSYKIAIDGTAGSGKSTICKLISSNLDFVFISTGGFYRAYAYILKRANLVNSDEYLIISELDKFNVTVKGDMFYINGDNVNQLLRDEQISLVASEIAQRKYIREYVNKNLKKIINDSERVIMDGRGIAEEMMPDANLKFYFYSSLKIRAKRRKDEFNKMNKNKSFLSIYLDLFKRDWKDKHRELAPSRSTSETIKINTTKKSIEKVFEEVKKYIKV